MEEEYKGFPKIPRLFDGEIVITEKIDGTNGLVYVAEDGTVRAGSRNRWLTVESDNYGFAAWVAEHQDELRQLGPGKHFGEWWGQGIQRRYGMDRKRFSLFNVKRWEKSPLPQCCGVVPVLFSGVVTGPVSLFDVLDNAQLRLIDKGSLAAPGFMNPEGLMVYHARSGQIFKWPFNK